MDFIHFNSIENILGINAKAIFKVDSSTVFKEDAEMITPVPVDEHLAYMPWGGDNLMPYNIINLIESDETLATCQLFNAEVCFGSGLVYDESTEKVLFFKDQNEKCLRFITFLCTNRLNTAMIGRKRRVKRLFLRY